MKHSSAARDEVLSGLRRSLTGARHFHGSSGHPPVVPPRVPMTVTAGKADEQTLAMQFGARLEEIQGSFEVVERGADVAERVVRQIRRWGEQSNGSPKREAVLGWAPAKIPVPHLERRLSESGISILVPDDLHDGELRARAASLEVGITGVDAAFASTGSAVLASGAGKNRAASLLPLHHLMIVPTSRIYATIEDWLQLLRQENRLTALLRGSGQITFVTGPSKSADIELTLTLGVHGPKAVHAVVFDDSRPGL